MKGIKSMEDMLKTKRLLPHSGARSRIENIPLIGKSLSMIFSVPNPNFHFKSTPADIAYDRLIKETLRKNPKAKILNIGSRGRRFPNVVNLDIVDCGNADIIADASDMPIADNTFDLVVNIAVLQHVKEPHKVASECFRVLKPGGKIYATAPFFYMFHTDPIDIQRYTHMGLANLFREFHCIKCGVENGPASAAVVSIREFFAILFSFNSAFLYNFFQILFGYLFYPMKFLDFFLTRSRFAFMMSSSVYFVGVKEADKRK